MPGYVEMHAIPLSGDVEQLKLARCVADDDDPDYRCAVALTEMCGIRLTG